MSDTCQFNYTHISHAYPSTRAEFGHWDDSTQALILSAFSYGYVLTQLPAGVVVVRYGGKWLLALSLLISALLSLLSTMAARLDYRLFIVTRIGLGLCDGVIYPSVYAMIGQWMPEWERCRGTAIILSGGSVGTIVATQLAGVLCEGHLWGGWPAVFYLQGIAGCVWFVLWSALVFESPEEHPYITVDEYEYIVVNQNPDNHKRRVMPWKGMLTSIPFYALTIAHICNDWTSYTMEALLPIYLANVLKLSVKRTALMSSLTYLSQTVIAWIAAHISDNLRESNFDINIIRKTNHAIAYLGPALFLLGVIYARCHTTAIIAMFIVATGLNGCHFSSLKSTHVDMAPDFAGTLYGVTNSMAGVSGLIAPQFAAYFLNNGVNIC
ncbi:unnamed protein product [Medioppia subpectinata]|uniref:Major facilitator superfamily (MFS) profile domain-containing protein n=1 Tax=Medioppia subpectinata TaxID=1979941 RepID=A0A7R9L1I7_9ACAR|nr:unnamed protein product [Medioppia subpectinata]CAG2113501.1 unnamed protein product [Medioppia subpectinata]